MEQNSTGTEKTMRLDCTSELRCWFGRLGCVLALVASAASGQMIRTNTPLQTLGDGYYERFQTGFSYQKGNFFFAWNPQVVPPFGGYDPSADARLGFSGRGPGGGRFNFGLTMGQGSSRSNSLVAPSLTVPNGGGGNIINSSFQPFVTSFIPIVGDGGQPKTSIATEVLRALESGETMESLLRKYGTGGDYDASASRQVTVDFQSSRSSSNAEPEPLPAASTSSAEYGDISVAEIRRRQKSKASAETNKLNREFVGLMERGQDAEQLGNLTLARFSYRTATRKATGSNVAKAREAFQRVNRQIERQREQRKAARKSSDKETDVEKGDIDES